MDLRGKELYEGGLWDGGAVGGSRCGREELLEVGDVEGKRCLSCRMVQMWEEGDLGMKEL